MHPRIAYNSMIDAHAEAGDGEKAAAWLQKAMDAGHTLE